MWWRNNRLALVALVVLAPAVVAAVGYQDWHAYRQTQPAEVARGVAPTTVDYAGARWTVTNTQRLHVLPHLGDDHPVPLPDGLDVVAVNIRVNTLAGTEGRSSNRALCALYLGDGDRRWAPTGPGELPGDVHWPNRDAGGSCDQDGPMSVLFLIPSAAQPDHVDVSVNDDGRPTYARLTIKRS